MATKFHSNIRLGNIICGFLVGIAVHFFHGIVVHFLFGILVGFLQLVGKGEEAEGAVDEEGEEEDEEDDQEADHHSLGSS